MMTISTNLFNTRNLLILIFSFIIHLETIAQNDSKEFEIEIINTKSGFDLKSNEGSRWSDLSFSTTFNKSQKISEEGMESSRPDSTPTEHTITNYLFTISKKNDKITLIGLKGTTWEKLSFTLSKNKTQKINQDGMVK